MSDNPPTEIIKYTIFDCSSHSGDYRPENILVDKPQDSKSRWSGIHPSSAHAVKQKPWVLLQLESPAVVKSITFGKFHKPHPCNLKEFKVFVGLTPSSMVEVLHAELKNQPNPECFPLSHRNMKGMVFASRYVKVVPLSAQAQSYNTSIWFIQISGVIEQSYVERSSAEFLKYKEDLALRLLCKHLRSRRLSYKALLLEGNIQLEHPTISSLYDELVLHGDFAESERLIQVAAHEDSLFDSYIQSTMPELVWNRILDTNPDGDSPPARGGHQLCLDEENGLLYLFGGWDGRVALADFWVYSLTQQRWELLSGNTADEDGPSSRSCHKMAFHPLTGHIYLLGQFPTSTIISDLSDLDSEKSSPPNDFWRYHTQGFRAGKWELISTDTSSKGGPSLVQDHNMVIDPSTNMLIVFGGRIHYTGPGNIHDSKRYSGLYLYNIVSDTWRLVFEDPSPTSQTIGQHVPGRAGHEMVFDNLTHQVYIFGGQRTEQNRTRCLADMWSFSTLTHEVNEVFGDFSSMGGPPAGFSQTAVLNRDSREIYLLGGLAGEPQGGQDICHLDVWIYRLDSQQWSKVHEGKRPESSKAKFGQKPGPRYAHHTAFHHGSGRFYLFGGNPGGENSERLDDFWYGTMKRPRLEELLRKATLVIRQQRFIEMCGSAAEIQALTYLQTDVSTLVNHADPREAQDFRGLLTHLMSLPPKPVGTGPSIKDAESGGSRSSPIQQEPRMSGFSQNEHQMNYPPSPDSATPIARASGSSFPPPPSPQTDDDADAQDGVGPTTPVLTRKRPGSSNPSLHASIQIRSLMDRFAEVGEPPLLPPPAPQLQHQALPIKLSESQLERPRLTSSASLPITSSVNTYNQENLVHSGQTGAGRLGVIRDEPGVEPNSSLFKARTQLFDRLLEYVSPEAKEPGTNLLDLIEMSPEVVARVDHPFAS